jgi:hypothetical protein
MVEFWVLHQVGKTCEYQKTYFRDMILLKPCYVGSLSPYHEAYSVCGWRNGLQQLRLAANILNKKSWTDNKGWPTAWGLDVGLTTPSP